MPQEADARKRVLIVDDEKEVIEFIRDAIEHKYEVLAARSAGEALSVLKTETVDLILLDIAMPETDGINFLRQIRSEQRHAATPVCMVTAHAARSRKYDSLRAGADDYLVKPFRIEVLLKTIARLLGEE